MVNDGVRVNVAVKVGGKVGVEEGEGDVEGEGNIGGDEGVRLVVGVLIVPTTREGIEQATTSPRMRRTKSLPRMNLLIVTVMFLLYSRFTNDVSTVLSTS